MLAWLTFLVCVLSQFPLSGHEVIYVTSPQSAYNIIQERENPSSTTPPETERVKLTSSHISFINHEHNSVHLLDSRSSCPCTPGSWSHAQISQRPFIEDILCAKHCPEAEDIKMQRKNARCSRSSRVSRLGGLLQVPTFPFSLFLHP